MFLKLILALITYKGLRKMEKNFNKNANLPGAQNGGKKSGVGWKLAIIVILAVLVISPIDLIPGDPIILTSYIDDIAYVAGIIGTVVSMIKGKRVQQIPGAGNNSTYVPPMYNEVKSNKKK